MLVVHIDDGEVDLIYQGFLFDHHWSLDDLVEGNQDDKVSVYDVRCKRVEVLNQAERLTVMIGLVQLDIIFAILLYYQKLVLLL